MTSESVPGLELPRPSTVSLGREAEKRQKDAFGQRGSRLLQRIEQLATLSVARGCGFAALGIVTFMFGLSANVAHAMQAGGYLSLVVSLVLLHKARVAGRRSYRSTELWILLDPEERPAADVAQRVIGSVLREVYLRFAQRAALVAACLLAGAIAYALLPWRAN